MSIRRPLGFVAQPAARSRWPWALALVGLGSAFALPMVVRADDEKLYAASIAAADATLRLHDTKAARRWLAEAPKALRGFEWRYLNGRADDSTSRVDTTVPTNDVAVSPDGALVASTGRDGSVKLWDGQNFKPLRSLVGHTAAAWGVAFSPDGRALASGSSDGTVRVWSIAKGAEVHRLSPPAAASPRWPSVPMAGFLRPRRGTAPPSVAFGVSSSSGMRQAAALSIPWSTA